MYHTTKLLNLKRVLYFEPIPKGEKLHHYKLIPTIKHILFVDQDKPFASVYSRTKTPDEWLNHDYWSLEEVVRLGEIEMPMRDIYNQPSE